MHLVKRLMAGSALLLAASAMLFLGGSGSEAGASPSTVPATVAASNWSATPVPSPFSGRDNDARAVSCVSSVFCIGAGFTYDATDSFYEPLIQSWNGSTWTATPLSLPTGSSSAEFKGVSCSSTTFCMAVGFQIVSGIDQPLAESWNGSSWSMTASPAGITGSLYTQMTSVSCLSTSFCVVAGYGQPSAGFQAILEQWNGTTWSANQAVIQAKAYLLGISCTTMTFCMAVGGNQASAEVTFTEMWNGAKWSVQASPNATTATSFLTAVSCAGVAFCAAVGDGSGSGPNNNITLIDVWNGSTWTQSPSPNSPGLHGDYLYGVSCFSATSCSAVGSAYTTASVAQFQNEALVWNGQSWSMVTPANSSFSPPQAGLNAVACITDWACVAVGYASNGTNNLPYNEWAPIARSGYRFVASDGGIFAFGGASAPFLGSLGSVVLNKPIVGMAVMPAGDGYYLVASDGGVFSFGSAQFYGSTGAITLNKPIVGMALTADGAGYWLVASDGGIFSFGDAQFYGSTGALTLNKPIVGMATTPNGLGYYLVASDGGIFAFGNATFMGSTGALTLNKPIVGMGETTSGGYYLVATDGGIFTFPSPGGPPFLGSTGSLVLNKPIVGMATVSGGYYLVASDGGIFTFPPSGGPPFLGSTGSLTLNKPIVGMAS
jgi:hypothetical protein